MLQQFKLLDWLPAHVTRVSLCSGFSAACALPLPSHGGTGTSSVRAGSHPTLPH